LTVARAAAATGCLRVVVLYPDAEPKDARELRQVLGGETAILVGGAAERALSDLGLGVRLEVVLFIDANGKVVHRVWNIGERDIVETLGVVESMAWRGAPPQGAVVEARVALGDCLAVPSQALECPDGSAASLHEGLPRLVFCGSPLDEGQSAAVRRALATLRGSFPEVEFLWIHPYVSASACEAFLRCFTFNYK